MHREKEKKKSIYRLNLTSELAAMSSCRKVLSLALITYLLDRAGKRRWNLVLDIYIHYFKKKGKKDMLTGNASFTLSLYSWDISSV